MSTKHGTGFASVDLKLTRDERDVLIQWVRTRCLSIHGLPESFEDLTVIDLDGVSDRVALIARVIYALETDDLDSSIDDFDVIRFVKAQAVAACHEIAEAGHDGYSGSALRAWNSLERKFEFDRRWLLGDSTTSWNVAMGVEAPDPDLDPDTADPAPLARVTERIVEMINEPERAAEHDAAARLAWTTVHEAVSLAAAIPGLHGDELTDLRDLVAHTAAAAGIKPQTTHDPEHEVGSRSERACDDAFWGRLEKACAATDPGALAAPGRLVHDALTRACGRRVPAETVAGEMSR